MAIMAQHIVIKFIATETVPVDLQTEDKKINDLVLTILVSRQSA